MLKLLKNILSPVIAGAMLAGFAMPYADCASVICSAEEQEVSESIWTGEADTSWYDGEHSSYDIRTPEQLSGLSQLVNEGNPMSGITINLVSDIIMNDTANLENWEEEAPANCWTPIGSEASVNPFCGLFNGNGHTIKGMYCSENDAAGLFGYLYCAGVVRLVMEDCFARAYYVTDDVYSGGIAAIADGAVISECEYSGKVIAYAPRDNANGLDSTYVGGITGACTISRASVAPALLEMLFMSMGFMVNPALLDDGSGGMIKSSYIVDCINYANVRMYNATFSSYIGGITGYGHTGKIINSMHLGTMYVWYYGSFSAGGIAGMLMNSTMENCYHVMQSISGVGEFEPSFFNPGIDNSVSITLEEFSALDAGALEEAVGTAFFSDGEKIHLKSDRRFWEALYGKTGDVNQDGEFSVMDIVALHKYLLTSSDAEVIEWHTGDIYEDGKLNIYDLILLKRKLIYG